MDYLKTLPQWALIAIGLYIAVIFSFAVMDGRRVSFWPPEIHEKSNNDDDQHVAVIEQLEDLLSAKENHVDPELIVEQFPERLRKSNLEASIEEVASLATNYKIQAAELAVLRSKLKHLEDIEGNFLYRLLSFHSDISCHGGSVNFTYFAWYSPTCKDKQELAGLFLGFLAEIEFYSGPITKDATIAKAELIRYQQSKEFGAIGWYGRDVFKWIVLDYYGKS